MTTTARLETGTGNELNTVLKYMQRNISTSLGIGVARMLLDLQNAVVRGITHGEDGIKTDTGRLRGSFETNIDESEDKVTGELGTNLIYARIHEYGGTIYPKKGKYLIFKIGNRTIFSEKVNMPRREYFSRPIGRRIAHAREVLAKALQQGVDDAAQGVTS